MGLAVAVGSKSVSSRTASAAVPVEEEYGDDGMTLLRPGVCGGRGGGAGAAAAAASAAPVSAVAVAISPDQELQAVVTLSYYDMVVVADAESEGRRGDHDENDYDDDENDESDGGGYSVAALKVQILPSTDSSLSTARYRDSVHHVRLPRRRRRTRRRRSRTRTRRSQSPPAGNDNCDGDGDDVSDIEEGDGSAAAVPTERGGQSHRRAAYLDAAFSGDRRFLSCLVPCHGGGDAPPSSVVVVFQLRRPRKDEPAWSSASASDLAPPPLPSYVQRSRAVGGGSNGGGASSSSEAAGGRQPANAAAAAASSSPAGGGGGGGGAVVPVATNPRVTRGDGSDSTSITSIEDLGSADVCGPSVLLAGCDDGSILAISYRPFVVAGSFFRPVGEAESDLAVIEDDENDEDDENEDEDGEESDTRRSSSTGSSAVRSPMDRSDKSILQLKHIAEASQRGSVRHQGGGGGETAGRLVALRGDGSVSIFRTNMVMAAEDHHHNNNNNHNHDQDATETSGDASERSTVSLQRQRSAGGSAAAAATDNPTGTLLLAIDLQQTITVGRFVCAEWISSSYLALMAEPSTGGGNDAAGPSSSASSTSSKLQVWAVPHSHVPESHPIATWEMTLSRLLDCADTTYYVIGDDDDDFVLVGDESSSCDSESALTYIQRGLAGNVALHYDSFSDCLGISSVLEEETERGESSADDSTDMTATVMRRRPFVCIWSWRCNVEGLVIMPTEPSLAPALSELFFCKDEAGARKLSHVVAGRSRSDGGLTRIRKEMYDAAVLSPSSGRIHQRAKLQRTNFLMVSAESVAFPCVSCCSATGNFDVEWQEAKIPLDYLLSRGSPRLAVVGPRNGKSIAVASARGLCGLLCGEKLSVQHNTQRGRVLKQSRASPRWYRSGNETEEGAFRVLAMSWWEGTSVADDTGAVADDILVCLIEVVGGRDKGRYLSCWAQRRFDLNHQLLHRNSTGSFSQWGIRLPNTFHPNSLDILENPKQATSFQDGRKAVVLLTDLSASTSFLIYHLETGAPAKLNTPTSYPEMLTYFVFAELASSGSVGAAAEIFLAGASFAFDIAKAKVDSRSQKKVYVATIGVIRDSGGGVDALAVSESYVSAVGQVVDVHADRRCSDVSRYWYADFIENRNLDSKICPLDYFVWSLQLANGALLCWSVPNITSSRELDVLLNVNPDENASLVHPKSMILGCTSAAGKTSSWMQQPSMGPRRVFSLGPVPRSSFGCILGSGQGCRKLHRSLCEDFEHQIFRPDFLDHELFFPSDFVLSLPSFVPSLYCLMSDTVKTTTCDNPGGDVSCAFEHLHKHLNSCLYRESAGMSVELLILRVLESMASKSCSPDKDELKHVRALFALLVEALRHQNSSLQFAKRLLEVARQIEPSYFRHMFPLPSLAADNGGNECVLDLFNLSLEHGALSVAVAFLPLFEDGDRIRSSCAAVFHHCLHAISDVWNDSSCVGFDILPEERAMISDLFRYSIKVEGTRDDISDATVSNCDEPSDCVVNDNQKRGYSIMCGMFFGRRKREEREALNAASSFISDGFHQDHNPEYSLTYGTNGHQTKMFSCKEEYAAESVAGVTARFLLASVVSTGSETSSSNRSKWRKLSGLAGLLVGESSSGFPLCSKSRFLELLGATSVRSLELLVSTNKRRRVGLVGFLVRSITECQSELSREKASPVLDLILILLNRHGMSEDLTLETPGLLLIALVVGHASGRSTDLLSERVGEDPVVNAYLDAAFEIANSSQLNGPT